jgi:hypothetical protein
MAALPYVQFIYGYRFQYLAPPSGRPMKEEPFSIIPLSISQSLSDLLEDVHTVIDADFKAYGGYFFLPPFTEFETFTKVVTCGILATPTQSNVSSDNDLSLFGTISDSSNPGSPSINSSTVNRYRSALRNKKLAFMIFKYL